MKILSRSGKKLNHSTSNLSAYSDVSTGSNSPMTSPGKDPLVVESGPIARSMTKCINEAMGLLVQASMDEMGVLTSQGTSLKKEPRVETKWKQVIQAAEEEGAGRLPCGRM